MNVKKAAEKALNELRRIMSEASGSEEVVLREFSDRIGTELDAWDMRLEELAQEADEVAGET